MRLVHLSLPLLFAGGLLLASQATCDQGDSVEKGCQSNEDCPRPDRQICELQTGVCVGFTSLPGRVDGGDGEGIDGGADPDGGREPDGAP